MLDHINAQAARIQSLEVQLAQAQEQVKNYANYAAGYEAGITAYTAQLPNPHSHGENSSPEFEKGWKAGWSWMDDYIKAQALPHATVPAPAAEAGAFFLWLDLL